VEAVRRRASPGEVEAVRRRASPGEVEAVWRDVMLEVAEVM